MKPEPLRLYHYWRSSCSWRVRWAIEIKKIECELIPVDLLAGEQDQPAHLARSPLGAVPVLEIDDNTSLTQSLAIIQWLEARFPTPAVLPSDPIALARTIELAETINADTQPLQNLPAQALHSKDPDEKKRWAAHWIREGLLAYETLVKKTAGRFSIGDAVTLADLCLIPQVYNAHRYGVSLEEMPTIARINEAALATDACEMAHPDRFKPAHFTGV